MLKLYQVLKSSRAAIDLASIMVGIIVIGLIGGVIAATVFAVIPWAQNNAAKQQLDSVVSAESSYRGLSADKDTTLQNAASSPTSQTDPNQVVLNSTFTGSAGLAKNNLLSLNANGLYCVIATTDGKDYHAYSKSGSGQWYYATSGKTQPTEYAGTAPCLTTGVAAGTVDTAIDNGSGAVPTTPSTGGGTTAPNNPTYTTVGTYDMESYNTTNIKDSGWTANNSAYNEVRIQTTASLVHGGKQAIWTYNVNSQAVGFNINIANVQPGTKYRITAYMGTSNDVGTAYIKSGTDTGTSVPTPGNSKYALVSLTTTANATTLPVDFYAQSGRATTYTYLDDVTIEKVTN